MKVRNRCSHLAIFNKPYLDLIFQSKKTIESRFSMNRIAPFGKISEGDVIMMKKSGGLVLGEFTAGKILTFENIQAKDWKEIKKYGMEIGAYVDGDFWNKREKKRFAILIEIKNPIRYQKPKEFIRKRGDKRGWIVLDK